MPNQTSFKDLVFQKHPIGSSWAGGFDFKNGYRISVVAGPNMYCSPKLALPDPFEFTEYEVAVLDNTGAFITNLFSESDEDVLGWQTPTAINEIMLQIEKLNT